MSNSIRVTTQSELDSALKAAKGGETITLADGHYGALATGNDYASNVTIRAENALQATFDKINFYGATNISVDGLKVDTGLSVERSSVNISVLNSDINGTLYCRNVDGLIVDNVTVDGLPNNSKFGLLLNSIQNFTITNNRIGGTTEDVMRITGNSYNGLMENNVLHDTVAERPTHPDMLQFFGANGYTPHDITIRGNVFCDNQATGSVNAQGIFVSDPGPGGFKNILIEDNMINVGSPNSIYINGGQENVVVRNNTLIPGAGDGGAIIRLAGKAGYDNSGTTIEGNVAKMMLDETHSSQIVDNHLYGRHADLGSLFIGTNGSSWENFLPAEGSAIDFGSGFGAATRLTDLLMEHYGQTVIERDFSVTAPADATVIVPDAPDAIAMLFSSAETHLFDGAKANLVTVAADEAVLADQGTISLSFNADTVSGSRGLISKGAAGRHDDLSAWIQNGKLSIAFENDEGKSGKIDVQGIKAGTDYKLQISYDEGHVNAYLNGELVGSRAFDLDLSGNHEALVLGGVNGQSTRGTTDHVSSFFDGTISGVAIYDHAMTPADLTAHLSASQVRTVYEDNVAHSLDGKTSSIVTVAADQIAMADEGTISLSFNADSVSGYRGLISRGAAGHDDDLSIWVQNGKLVVAFENDEGKSGKFDVSGIEAGTDYKLQVTYDEEHVTAYLNGVAVGSRAFDLDMSGNDEALVIGGINGQSTRGTTDRVSSAFDGRISDVAIYDHVMTPAEMADHLTVLHVA